jgi:hypothetical protein
MNLSIHLDIRGQFPDGSLSGEKTGGAELGKRMRGAEQFTSDRQRQKNLGLKSSFED